MKRRLPTIRDVAAQAGVSVGTASKALNNQGRLSATTRAAVLRAAEELHFSPNALIRSLQRGKTGVIGVLTWPVTMNVNVSITMPLLSGISVGLAANHRDLLLYSRYPGRDDLNAPMTFLDGRVDGAILGPYDLSPAVVRGLEAAQLPVVAIYQRGVPETFGLVTVDNVGGVQAAMDHLLALGHRRIAFFGPGSSYDFKERQFGYRAALEAAGIPFDSALCLTPENYNEPVTTLCDILLALPEPPTALLSGDDNLALRWIQELTQRGLRLPRDFSVVGFDDVPAASNSPSLTTIRQPALLVGQQAASFVDQMIHGTPASQCRAVLPVELIVRESSGPPPLKGQKQHS